MFLRNDAARSRSTNGAWLLVMFLVAMLASSSVLARNGGHHRSRAHFGVFIGAPVFWHYSHPFYHYPSAYYYPPVVVAPASPPVYIERGDSYTPPEQAQGFWYYCAEARAYYPYVKQCAGGWQRVSPQPPPG